MKLERIRVLLVEDDNGDALLVEFILEELCDRYPTVVEWTRVRKLAEALKAISRDDYDVALVDLTLPDSQGVATVVEILKASQNLSVIVLTGFGDTLVGLHSIQEGAQDFLVKGELEASRLYRSLCFGYERGRLLLDLKEQRHKVLRLNEQLESSYQMELAQRKQVEGQLDFYFNAPLGLMAIADRNGCIVRVNPSWEQALGYSAHELVGLNIKDFWHLDCAPSLDWERDAGVVKAFECRARHQDGSFVWLSWRMVLDKEHGQIHLAARDVTAAKRIEREREEARVAAEQASRAKSLFLTNMSHELRTPLNAILGFSDIMLGPDTEPVSQQQAQYLGLIQSGGKQLLELINGILDLAKIESGQQRLEMVETNVSEELEAALRIIRPLAQAKNLQLTQSCAEALKPLLADRGRFRQILLNILGNAVKYTPDGGRVEVRVGLGKASRLHVEVEDSGIGIDRSDQERIFEVFERVDTAYARDQQGTGVGLALTKQLVTLHGGRLWVESEGLGCGSRFVFELPLEGLEVS